MRNKKFLEICKDDVRSLPPKLKKLIPQNRREPVDLFGLNKPRTGSQSEAFYSQADILGYMGQPGGGKTSLLVFIAVFQFSKSIIFRKEYPQLTQVADEINRVVGSYGTYNKVEHLWKISYPFFDGRRWITRRCEIQLGACNSLEAAQKFQGRPYPFMGFDEGTHYTEEIVRFLLAWNRPVKAGQRCRVVITGNPPIKSDGIWIRDYFAPWISKHAPYPAEPGELRWFITSKDGRIEVPDNTPVVEDGVTLTPYSMTFYQSKLRENTTLWEANYIERVRAMPEKIALKFLAEDPREAFSFDLEDDDFQVIPRKTVELAVERGKRVHIHHYSNTRLYHALGVDVARGGKDYLVIAILHDNFIIPLVKIPGINVSDGYLAVSEIKKVFKNINNQKSIPIQIDIHNVGNAPVDILRQEGYRVIPINSSSSSSFKPRHSYDLGFVNKRAELWWKMRILLEKNLIDLPNDKEMIEDLCSANYTINHKNEVVIEPKDNIKKRLGRSPDSGEAVIYALASYKKLSNLQGTFRPPVTPLSLSTLNPSYYR